MNLLMFYTNTRVSFKSGLFLYWFDINFNQMPELTVKLFILHLKFKKKTKKHLFLVGSALLVGAKLGFLSDWFGHSGSPEGPHTILWQQCGFFTRTRAAGFMRARQTDPLDAIKPSTSEQRGQVLGASLRAHLHPAGEKTAPSQ